MNQVDRARKYISDRVFDPIIAHPDIPEKTKNVNKDARKWIGGLERVGDLYTYMTHVIRSNKTSEKELARFAELGLDTYESIISNFSNTFQPYLDQRTTVDDFVMGTEYTSWVINGVAKIYDLRSGGILSVGSAPKHSGVLIKVNLSGGKYDNEWLEGQRVLKYYLKATKTKSSETFSEARVENKAIIGYPELPVYVFTRPSTKAARFTFSGHFSCVAVHTEPDGKKWFELHRSDTQTTNVLMSKLLTEQAEDVIESKKSPKSERMQRLMTALIKPKQVNAVTIQYYRNPDVIAEVLDRAGGVCEKCEEPAPFNRVSDGTPYLEVHHKKRLADDGDDTVENAIALCPNCHRHAHYG